MISNLVGSSPIQNTFPFLGLHARADSVHVKMQTPSTQKNSMRRVQDTYGRTLQLLNHIRDRFPGHMVLDVFCHNKAENNLENF